MFFLPIWKISIPLSMTPFDFSDIRFFSYAEVAKVSDDIDVVSSLLIHMLDFARLIAGIPIRLTSVHRSADHNKRVGGVRSSSHVSGLAADIRAASSHEKYILVRALLSAGFVRIGVGSNFIHVDIDDSKPQSCFWTY